MNQTLDTKCKRNRKVSREQRERNEWNYGMDMCRFLFLYVVSVEVVTKLRMFDLFFPFSNPTAATTSVLHSARNHEGEEG